MYNRRRQLLGAGVAVAFTAFVGASGRAFATLEDVARAITEFGGEFTVEEGGPLTLTTPEIAENGNSVPISFSVDSPMSAEDHVVAVMILAPENPDVDVATFHFTPASGLARVSTRMRLARTQQVFAVAKTSTGRLYRVANEVKVTIGGCGS